MNHKKSKTLLVVSVVALILVGATQFAISRDADAEAIGEASVQEKTFSNDIMQSISDRDYQKFVADGDRGFHQIKESDFKGVCTSVTPRLKKGYHVIFLGGLKMTGGHVTLWKITFDDKGDDMVLHLSTQKSKINGALLTSAFQ